MKRGDEHRAVLSRSSVLCDDNCRYNVLIIEEEVRCYRTDNNVRIYSFNS